MDKWKHTLQFLENIEIPRWHKFTNADFVQVQLHIFADTSQYAFLLGNPDSPQFKRNQQVFLD